MSRNFELLTDSATAPSDRDLPHAPSLPPRNEPQVALEEATSDEDIAPLVQQLFLSHDRSSVHHVIFCPPDQTASSSAVCVRAARELATQSTRAVCLIDLNGGSHDPQAFAMLGGPLPTPSTPADLRDHCRQLNRNLWQSRGALLSNASGSLLSPDQLACELQMYYEAFDHVLINAPGVTASRVVPLLGPLVDGAVLVIEAHRTRRAVTRRAKEVLDGSGVRLLGTVLNNRTFPIPAALYKRL